MVNFLQKENFVSKSQENVKPLNKIIYSDKGSGSSSGCKGKESVTSFIDESSTISFSGINPLRVTSKPQPKYTDAARQNQVQGKVVLRVTFLANGKIGNISTVVVLPYGLTEQAILAAKQMEFEPYTGHGMARTVTKTVQYNFTIY